MVGVTFTRQVCVEALRRKIARTATVSTRAEETAPLGIAEVDSCLNGGLARGALHEIAAADHRSLPAALGFLLALSSPVYGRGVEPKARQGGDWFLPCLRGRETTRSVVEGAGALAPLGASRHSPRKRGESHILWPFTKTAPAFGLPYPPGLKFFGLDPARIMFVRCTNTRECLWAMEEGLRLGGIGAVIGARSKGMDLTASRRLQLAAEQANTPVFLLRHYSDGAQSAAVTRWRVSSAPSARDQFGFYKNVRFRVALEYARGGKMGQWVLEWDHDALLLRLASALGDRTAGENRAA